MRVRAAAVLLVLLIAGAPPRSLADSGDSRRPSSAPTQQEARAALASLPAAFEPNRGQADGRVRFLARARGFRAFFTDDETLFVLPRGTDRPRDPLDREPPPSASADLVRMRLLGARPSPPRAGGLPMPGVHHYLLGDDASRWVRDVPRYGAIRGRGVLPGIDLLWRGLPGGRLEYDFLLAPGADPGLLRLRFEGADSLAVDGSGDLLVATRGGVLRHRRPVAWQDPAGGRRSVDARFRVLGEGGVSIEVGPHDPSIPLVVDPEIVYSTYLGGDGADGVHGVTLDSSGRACIAGSTSTVGFPVVAGFQPSKAGNTDAFVSVFAADGQALAWSTFFGGSTDDYAACIAIDGSDRVVVGGWTTSTNFPKQSPVQGGKAGGEDGFVAKFAAGGASLVFSTYLGGSTTDRVQGAAVAADGSVFVTGETVSGNFPVTLSCYQGTLAGNTDAFVTKYASDGSAMEWSTYLGGAEQQDRAFDIALGAGGLPVVVGFTGSSNFPTVFPIQEDSGGSVDAFAACVSGDGTSLEWSTYLGGSGDEYAYGVAASSTGVLWVVGETSSADFPVLGAAQPDYGGGTDAFVTRISPDGTGIQMSTYLGGSVTDTAAAVTVDAWGSAAVVGSTNSADFPLAGELQGTKSSLYDLFVTLYKPDASSPPFSTYLGGDGDDRGTSVAVDGSGRIFAGGLSGNGSTFPRVSPFQSLHGGAYDGILACLLRLPPPPPFVGVKMVALRAVQVDWTDSLDDEDGYRVERSVSGGPFEEIAALPADTVSMVDGGLIPSTDYVYRVRTDSGGYLSDPSEEAAITTPPTPTAAPAAPSLLTAVVVSPRRVDLAWQDNSDTEDFFLLSRAPAGSLFSTLATPQLGAESWSDLTPLPGRTYSYMVRAVNPKGASLDTNIETVTMPTTLEVAVVKGKILDKARARTDVLVTSGTFAFGGDSEADAFDPATTGFALRLGDMETAPLLAVSTVDMTWKVKNGVYSWKSEKGALTKAKLLVDPAAGTWAVTLKKLTLAAPPANPVRISLSLGDEAGHSEADWTPGRKAGQFRFP